MTSQVDGARREAPRGGGRGWYTCPSTRIVSERGPWCRKCFTSTQLKLMNLEAVSRLRQGGQDLPRCSRHDDQTPSPPEQWRFFSNFKDMEAIAEDASSAFKIATASGGAVIAKQKKGILLCHAVMPSL